MFKDSPYYGNKIVKLYAKIMSIFYQTQTGYVHKNNYAENTLTVYCGLGIVTPRKKSLFEKISICLGSNSPITTN